jgi:predicted nucleotidyltransferase
LPLEPEHFVARRSLRYDVLVDASFRPYIEAHRRAAETAAQRVAAAAIAARASAERVAAALAEQFGVSEVVLFGSLACGRFGDRSDIDLAVRGLEPSRLVDAHVLAARMVKERDVSIVPIERARDYIREAVARDGVRLWPR